MSALKSDGGQLTLTIDPLDVVRAYVADQAAGGAWIDEAAAQLTREWFSTETLRRQLAERRDILAAVESFLLAHWQEGADGGEGKSFGAGPVGDLARRTLAHYLASSEQRGQLMQLFELLAENVTARVTDPEKRRIYGRTLFGVGETVALEQWVAEKRVEIAACEDHDELFAVVWECIAARIENSTFKKWRPSQTTEAFARGWIAGDSFGELHDRMLAANVRVGLGTRPRTPKVEHVVEMGENALGFDGAHVLGAVTELFELLSRDDKEEAAAMAVLQTLQKRLKYGLPSDASILLYEAGFADRPLALELAAVLPQLSSRAEMRREMRQAMEPIKVVLARYPRYFSQVFDRVTGA